MNLIVIKNDDPTTSRVIYKYRIDVEKQTTRLYIPKGSLCLKTMPDPNGDLCVWFEVNPNEKKYQNIEFGVFLTGETFKLNHRNRWWSYLDSMLWDKRFVIHVYFRELD